MSGCDIAAKSAAPSQSAVFQLGRYLGRELQTLTSGLPKLAAAPFLDCCSMSRKGDDDVVDAFRLLSFNRGQRLPPEELMVRARRNGDIEKCFPAAKVTRSTKGDYLYRAVISRNEIAGAVAAAIQDIDYPNFKGNVEDDALHGAYLKVWSVMATLQEPPPYSGPINRNTSGSRWCNLIAALKSPRSAREARSSGVCRSPHVRSLASVIVCLRSIQKNPAIIDVENRVLGEHASNSGESTPPIAKTLDAATTGAGIGRPPPARWNSACFAADPRLPAPAAPGPARSVIFR